MFEPAALLDGLNEDQCQAVTHQGGPLLVLAGAGTGKTRTLVARAAWLRAQGVPASRILLLTFTRRAADDMLARVTPAGSAAADRVCGGTFHAVAHQIIRAHAESFSLPPAFSVIDPPDVTDLLDAARAEHGLVGTQRRAPRAATCADIYTRCVNTHATVLQVIKASFPWCADYETELGGLFRGYVAHKRQHGLVDFDDLLLLWRAALADPAAGPVLRGMFDAVLVDEYQDVNAVQADIVRLLRPDGDGLTCVGDDAQAIYAFRGADPAHLRELGQHYPGLEVVRLARNYRSKDAVLTLANTVRPQSPGLELALTADRGPGSRPQLVRCHDEATQAREICARVLAAHEAGADLRDQAVLMRAAGPQRCAGGGAVGPRYPVHQVRRAALHRGGARQGLPGRGPGGGQPGRRHRLVPGAPAARGRRPGARPAGRSRRCGWLSAARSAGGPTRPRRCRPGPRSGDGHAVRAGRGGGTGPDGGPGGGHPGGPERPAARHDTRMPASGSMILSGWPTPRPPGRRCMMRWWSWPSTRRYRRLTWLGRRGWTTITWCCPRSTRPRGWSGRWCI